MLKIISLSNLKTFSICLLVPSIGIEHCNSIQIASYLYVIIFSSLWKFLESPFGSLDWILKRHFRSMNVYVLVIGNFLQDYVDSFPHSCLPSGVVHFHVKH
jgi:hypothetical protein